MGNVKENDKEKEKEKGREEEGKCRERRVEIC